MRFTKQKWNKSKILNVVSKKKEKEDRKIKSKEEVYN